MRLRRWLRDHLIADWRKGWRFWSVRLEALAIASGVSLLAAPDLALWIWTSLPPHLLALLPPALVHGVPVTFGLLALAARFIQQKGLRDA